MDYKRYFQLIEMLVEKTRSGDVIWKKTADDNMLAAFKDYSIIMHVSENEVAGGDPDYFLTITDKDGELVESISDVDLNAYKADFPTYSNINYFKVLEKLYTTARKNSAGIRKALDSIIGELEDTDKIPF